MANDGKKTPDQALKGKAALVTGGSRGLGLEITRKFLAAGASVAVCGRNRDRLDQVQGELEANLPAGQKVFSFPADVSSRDDVSILITSALESLGRLDILVNNAGINGPLGLAEDNDWQEWVRTIEINLLGPVLACRAVLPHFKQQGSGKIIQISGGGALRPMPQASAYAASKAAVVRFLETLAAEVRERCIDVNAIAPGPLDTRLLDEAIAAGPKAIGEETYEAALKTKESGGAPIGKTADLAVYLGSPASDGITGKIISAQWDPWPTLSDHLDDLMSTDIYTLGRIVPRDRGKPWGTDT